MVIAIYRDYANLLVVSMADMRKTQEQLAEDLDMFRLTISNYCCAKSLPTDRKAREIAQVLRNPFLELEWLRANLIGPSWLPKVPNMPLSQTYLNFHSAIIKAVKLHYDLAEIVKDNRIDEKEKALHEAGSMIIDEIMAYGHGFKQAGIEKKRSRKNAIGKFR